MAVRNFQCRYKIYTKKEIDEMIDGIGTSIEDKQDKLTAGTNISISEENVISATGGTEYTAGTNISISDENVISATDTKYTAGTGISISEQNVISVSGGDDGEWKVGTNGMNWGSIFSIVNNKINILKDCIIARKYGYPGQVVFVGFKGQVLEDSWIDIEFNDVPQFSNNVLTIKQYMVRFTSVNLTGTNTGLTNMGKKITIDISNGISISTESTFSVSRDTGFYLYYKD